MEKQKAHPTACPIQVDQYFAVWEYVVCKPVEITDQNLTKTVVVQMTMHVHCISLKISLDQHRQTAVCLGMGVNLQKYDW